MSDTRYGIPHIDPVPRPEPEHQRRITRGKLFEIITVITLIIIGCAYLAWRDDRFHFRPAAAEKMITSMAALKSAGAAEVGISEHKGKTFHSYEKSISGFTLHADLVGGPENTPLETAILWLTPLPGAPTPPEATLREAVNAVGLLARGLVPSSTDAFEKAANTMELINDTPRPHDKGAAGSSDGWKLTYITYRAYDEHAVPSQPVLYLILQRLESGADDVQGALNRTLYEAVKQGQDIKTALKSLAP